MSDNLDACTAGAARPPVPATLIAATAVAALRAKTELSPKPGWVDTSVALLLESAESLREPLRQCAEAARTMPLGADLRARLGEIGRAAERRMLALSGSGNTHRGAMWALGLLTAGAAVTDGAESAASFAALVARIPDPCAHATTSASRYGARGANGEARSGFPHVIRLGLPALRASRRRGGPDETAALDALITIMANLDDTGVIHRCGPEALRAAHRRATEILRAGGCGTAEGRQRLEAFCREADDRRLSMGGSGDLLAATLFLDRLGADPAGRQPVDPRHGHLELAGEEE